MRAIPVVHQCGDHNLQHRVTLIGEIRLFMWYFARRETN
jgi:hypothetical protein